MNSRDWRPSPNYEKIASANKLFYAQSAEKYDTTESCVVESKAHEEVENDLDQILALLGRDGKAFRALDACGGSGNISLKLLRKGMMVTMVDISPELQAIFREKCRASGFTSVEVVNSEIGRFLAGTDSTFNLIVFSSALHHLENIEQVLLLAFDRLAPGGLLFTIFDPTLRAKLRSTTRALQYVEYLLFKLFKQTGDLPKTLWRRWRRLVSTPISRKDDVCLDAATAGLLAEYHVAQGIDDYALVAQLQRIGYEKVWHKRYASSRFGCTERLLGRLGEATSFKMLLRKPPEPH